MWAVSATITKRRLTNDWEILTGDGGGRRGGRGARVHHTGSGAAIRREGWRADLQREQRMGLRLWLLAQSALHLFAEAWGGRALRGHDQEVRRRRRLCLERRDRLGRNRSDDRRGAGCACWRLCRRDRWRIGGRRPRRQRARRWFQQTVRAAAGQHRGQSGSQCRSRHWGDLAYARALRAAPAAAAGDRLSRVYDVVGRPPPWRPSARLLLS